MLPKSAKGKGRALQNYVKSRILHYFPELNGHVKSTTMGESGEDIQLSPTARVSLPLQIECKNKARFAIYSLYEQAKRHGEFEPVLVIKQNHDKPLAVVDLEYLLNLQRKSYVHS
jgi:hypothetical protein